MSDHLALTLAVALLASPAAAQVPSPAQGTAEPDDIVVTDYRLRKDLDTTVRLPASISVNRNRRFYDDAARMAKCATRSRLSSLAWLRRVVDGAFNSPNQVAAQDRLARIYLTYGAGSAAALRQGIDATELQAATAMTGTDGLTPNIEAFPLGHSIYDRGACTVQVLKRFAPNLSLTPRQTADPAVQARFNAREVPRNRFHLPADYRDFEVAVCMVRVEPRLARSSGSARFGDVQAARNVAVDPTQFRLYIADAVYRWMRAARDVDTLIPADDLKG